VRKSGVNSSLKKWLKSHCRGPSLPPIWSPKGVRLMDKMVAGCLKFVELDDSYGAFAQFMEESTAP
jgi:hypothetical protein